MVRFLASISLIFETTWWCAKQTECNIEGEILFIHRGGKNNENEIGENIAVIRQESRHGIHIRRTSDKQEFTEAVP